MTPLSKRVWYEYNKDPKQPIATLDLSSSSYVPIRKLANSEPSGNNVIKRQRLERLVSEIFYPSSDVC